jgi:hypothetical protein
MDLKKRHQELQVQLHYANQQLEQTQASIYMITGAMTEISRLINAESEQEEKDAPEEKKMGSV